MMHPVEDAVDAVDAVVAVSSIYAVDAVNAVSTVDAADAVAAVDVIDAAEDAGHNQPFLLAQQPSSCLDKMMPPVVTYLVDNAPCRRCCRR